MLKEEQANKANTFRDDPEVCLSCATFIPSGKVLLGIAKDDKLVSICPICGSKQVMKANHLLLLKGGNDLRKWLKSIVIKR